MSIDTTTLAHLDQLRAETAAAVAEHQRLAAAARDAIVAAAHDGVICRDGANDALATWGLELLPEPWTLAGEGTMSYTRMHTDDAEAREYADSIVIDRLYPLLPTIWVDSVRVVDVALVHGEDDLPEVHPYRVTVRVGLRTGVTATSHTGAVAAAEDSIHGYAAQASLSGTDLTDLTWTVLDGPDHYDANADGTPGDADSAIQATPAPAGGGDLATATALRDEAVAEMAAFRRKIRARAIRALVDDELGGDYDQAADRVERFLVDLGLDGLPRAHYTALLVQLAVPIRAANEQQADVAAREAVSAVTAGFDQARRTTTGIEWTLPTTEQVGDGRWRVTWGHPVQQWRRGHSTQEEAAATAHALVREDLDTVRDQTGLDIEEVSLTTTEVWWAIDQNLDPDTD